MEKQLQITEGFCSLEVSRLLKDLGFDIPQDRRYYAKPDYQNDKINWVASEQGSVKDSNQSEFTISSPTHALAIEWIRVNFGYWIHTRKTSLENWIGYIDEIETKTYYNSPQEATEAALLRCLQMLTN